MRKKSKLVAAPSSTFLITCAATNEVFYRPVLAYEISEEARWLITNDVEDGDVNADDLGFGEFFAEGLLDDKGRVFCGRYLFQSAQEFIAFCESEFASNPPAKHAKSEAYAHPLDYELLKEADMAAQAKFSHADMLEAIRKSRIQ
jgi:hypothetical protein